MKAERLAKTQPRRIEPVPEEQLKAEAEVMPFAAYRDDPVGFAGDQLGIQPWSRQREIIEAVRDHQRVAVRSGHKISKALALDTPIPTPSGWSTMGELRVGDEVFSDTGHPCRVVGVSDVFVDHDCYEVEFDDGTTVVADAGHVWQTWSTRARRSRDRGGKSGVPQLVTTAEIAASVQSRLRGREHAIPVCPSVQTAHADLPIDPYLLGVWLGDGTSACGNVTTADAEIEQAFVAAGYATKYRAKSGRAWTFGVGGFTRELRATGVLNDKHVPAAYLRASRAQRMALLQGLLDTDGSCNATGRASFANTRRCLAEAAFELAASLGLKPHWFEGRAKDCGPVFIVGFTSHETVFRIPRKAARQRGAQTKASWCKQRMVVSVRKVASVPVRCIAVDSASHLFLCSRAFIPTHNTTTAVLVALWFFCTRSRAVIVVTATRYEQVKTIFWAELRRVLRSAPARDVILEQVVGGRVNLDPSTGLRTHDGRILVGVAAETTDAMGGFSSPELLFVVDEASGVTAGVFEAIEGNAAGGARRVLFGNPLHADGVFFEAFHAKSEFYKTIHVSSEESPNVTGTEPAVPGLAEKAYVEEKLREWGRDSPDYQARIAGNFPAQSATSIVALSAIEAAEKRRKTAQPDESEPLELGVDVARFGDDDSVIVPRRGYYAYPPTVVHGLDTVQVAGKVVEVARAMRRPANGKPAERVRVKVDVIGVGGGVADILRQHKDIIELVEVNVAERARAEADFYNLRSQLWFAMSEWLSAGGTYEPDGRLRAELLAPQYAFDTRGRRKVESKDEIKKRLQRSPDRADALALAVWREAAPIVKRTPVQSHNNPDAEGIFDA